MENNTEKVADNLQDMDSPFEEKVQDDSKPLTRTELMDKTGKVLAKLAMPYTTLKETTLSKLSKAELCDIILSKGTNKSEKESKGRASRTKSDSEAIIDTILSIAESFKLKREHDTLNATAKQIFKNNAINIVDQKVSEEAISSHGVNTTVAVFAGIFLLADGLIGIANIPSFFSKLKGKFGAKKTSTK